jgi:MmgE/PrpD N-terminal domain
LDHATAFLDWLACAAGGRDEPAARAARDMGSGLSERVAAAGTAGHVLDFDDTYLPGLARLSAPTAPAALLLGAELGRSTGDVLDAYAAGFEAMGSLAAAAYPALYDAGWHPTAVCGSFGAAVAAATLLDLDNDPFAPPQRSGCCGRAVCGRRARRLGSPRAGAARRSRARMSFVNCWPAAREGSTQSSVGAAPYSSSVTSSPQVTGLPCSSTSCMARWVMKRFGLRRSSPGSKKTRSPGRMTSIGPPRRWHSRRPR